MRFPKHKPGIKNRLNSGKFFLLKLNVNLVILPRNNRRINEKNTRTLTN